MRDQNRTDRAARHSALRRLGTIAVAAGTLTLSLAAFAAPAHAEGASGSTTEGTGWIRLTHLSPDTSDVNVTLTSLADSKATVKLRDVGYGDVSKYWKVPAGRYVAAMTPAGGSGSSKPVITQSVTVQNDYAYTVAAIGKNADLKGLVLNDDLRPPKSGQAKIRLIQASTNAPTVTVTAMGGPVLARDAAFGSATGYAAVRAGVWTVDLAPGSGSSAKSESVKVTARPGSVNTIVLLNGANGQLATKVLQDAGGTMTMPARGKGVETGGGGAATEFVTDPVAHSGSAPAGPGTGAVVGLAAAGLVGAVGVGVLRRRAIRRTIAACRGAAG
ncbi:hypothetical protein FHX74_000088 [Friedmanniella endophytica]|uniref:DUF4397 domain-containing protein n=1 Tax=Microlunatus kandeliicorticis TaxID=1759536 RepID=A0A7W3P433_9ACTN|nr:DUF4397 domain-containing protein [Microlunatus kandeliicorticis]MBA8792494.1 hypothetical protein [Microlunatus kandeliicorticis]